jgi:hypothetical protein
LRGHDSGAAAAKGRCPSQGADDFRGCKSLTGYNLTAPPTASRPHTRLEICPDVE